MARFLRSREKSKGEMPGALIFIGQQKVDQLTLEQFLYDPEAILEQKIESLEARQKATPNQVNWLNLIGLHDKKVIREFGKTFGLHDLLLEDIMNTGQRPKMEAFEQHLSLFLKMFYYDAEKGLIHAEQLCLVLSGQDVLTFQEQPGDVFDNIRQRLRKNKGRLRKMGADYLAYALLDAVVDNYISVIEKFGEKIEELEEEIIRCEDHTILEKLYQYKRELNYLRKSIPPTREAILQLSKIDAEDYFEESTLQFLKDLQDHITQASESIETYREILSDQFNLYHSTISYRLNEIMKVLTIFAAIFIPLTFIAGIYGTNFEYLPELHYKYSYFVFWGILILVAGIMLAYFKRKKWI